MAASGVILVSARAWRKGFGELPAGSGQHAGRRVHHLFCLCGSHVPLCGSMKMRSPSSIGAKSSWRPINVRRGWGVVALLVFAVVIGVAWWSMLRTTPVQYVTAPVVRGAITRVVTATGTVNPVLTIIVGTYVLRHNSEPLLRLQHAGEGRAGLRQDRSTSVSGDARSVFRRSFCAIRRCSTRIV